MDTGKTTLVILAAGMGSRFGGLKQIEPVGSNGEAILDFSIHDAVLAGFDKVVFIIKKDFEQQFHDTVGKRAEKKIKVEYAFQDMQTGLPDGFEIPAERAKPWGTSHALLCCRGVVDTPFGVINADDYYGQTSFKLLNESLKSAGEYDFSMVGFSLAKTLTENGTVARGVCVTEGGFLKGITERTKIRDMKYTDNGEEWIALPEDTVVSMNMWGFTPVIFDEIERGFAEFVRNTSDAVKDEYFIPIIVDELIQNKKARVSVLTTCEKWHGVTYKEDKPTVVDAIGALVERGLYVGL